jgi:hypothetical protein
MSEPSDQLLPYDRFAFLVFLIIPYFALILLNYYFGSELLVIFLKFLYDQDPVRQLLELSEADCDIEIEL